MTPHAKLLSTDDEQKRVELKNLKNSAAESFLDVKRFMLNLRSTPLDDPGLVPTLRRYLQS
jgi:signal transduction histidine kinase